MRLNQSTSHCQNDNGIESLLARLKNRLYELSWESWAVFKWWEVRRSHWRLRFLTGCCCKLKSHFGFVSTYCWSHANATITCSSLGLLCMSCSGSIVAERMSFSLHGGYTLWPFTFGTCHGWVKMSFHLSTLIMHVLSLYLPLPTSVGGCSKQETLTWFVHFPNKIHLTCGIMLYCHEYWMVYKMCN